MLAVAVLVLYGVTVSQRKRSAADRRKIGDLTTELDKVAQRAELVDILMDGLDRALLIVQRDGKIRFANKRAKETLGGGAMTNLFEAILSADLMESVKRVSGSGLSEVVEFQTLPDGRAKRALVFEKDADALCVIEDIDEIKRLETARKDFVANVSHELRTPLASIRAMAETLQGGARTDDEVAERYLGTIIGESDRLARIAEDLLILSRAESREPDRAVFDLGTLIDQTAKRFEQQAGAAEISLTVSCEARTLVFAARDQIEQALVNLLDNALKYTQKGGVVTVTMTQENGFAQVSVKDTGAGLAKADIPRIFERFYRVDKARSRKSGGTGLGLSIVKHVVEGNGGRVHVESELNHGSDFRITVPLADRLEEWNDAMEEEL